MLPRVDLRGLHQSEDSFTISRSIFTTSVILCLFAESHQAIKELSAPDVLNPLTLTRIQVSPSDSGVCQMLLLKHDIVFSWEMKLQEKQMLARKQ